MIGNELIMDLTQEQGPGRETQVQPPKGAWIVFFNVDLDDAANLPEYTLQNQRDADADPEIRPVVEHDHNWTVEIAGAEQPRPAIIRIRRVDTNAYHYWIYRPHDPEFEHCNWILDTYPNPHWHSGRRWLVI